MDEFVNLTGYSRSYASWLLRNCGRKVVMHREGKETVIFVGEIRKRKKGKGYIVRKS